MPYRALPTGRHVRRRNGCRALPAAGFLLATSLAAGCAINPVTGQRQLALISEAQEIQIGQQGAAEVEASLGLVDNPAIQAYVRDLGMRMASVSERPNIPWRFGVVDDPTPNAFALPGGPIYVTRGMMNLMGTEAQLASVLGHEIAHVTARHHVTSMSRTQLAQIGLGVGGLVFPQLEQLGGLAGAGLQLVFLSHGRDAERQADDLGFDYALHQGYDVREMAQVFASLQRLGDAQDQGTIPSWLMSHPAPADRIQAVQARLAALPAGGDRLTIGTQPYLERIDGLVHGVNPRNGFFRNGLFLHPDLQFQVALPAQWQRQNMAQAVMAMSPQQNAAIQLTLSEAASANAAAQAFLSQQGIQTGQTSRPTINGLSAVLASFQAQTQQQVLQGLVAFIEHGGRVYQIIGYSPAGVYGSYDQVFQQSLRSFAPVTDPQILNVQPDRISIVRTTESMTLTQFNQRFPSAVPIAELAILNQIADPNTPIPGGTLLKRVIPG